MSCPVCDHAMECIGECKVGVNLHWCHRCGTIKCGHETKQTPKLVARCRDYQAQFDKENIAQFYRNEWRRLGIAESINLPDQRPR